MKKYVLLILALPFALSLMAQEDNPKLAYEFFPGVEGTDQYVDFDYTYNAPASVALNPNLSLFEAKGATGRELYAVIEGTIIQVADINEGEGSSTPRFLTKVDDVVYFLANDGTSVSLYVTDGTKDGTKLAFGNDASGNGSDFSNLLVNGDKLFFALKGSIYRVEDNKLERLEYESELQPSSMNNYNCYSWTTYQDGFCIINQDTKSLITFRDGQFKSFDGLPNASSFDRYVSLSSIGDDIIFGVDSHVSDTEGTYIFEWSSADFNKIDDDVLTRSYSLDGRYCIGFNNKNTSLYTAGAKEGEILAPNRPPLNSGEDWGRSESEFGLLFVTLQGVFEDTEIMFFDATSGKSKVVHTTDDRSPFLQVGYDTYYFAENEEDVTNYTLYAYDHKKQERYNLVDIIDPKFNSAFRPLAVQKDKLYFLSDFDETNGNELYEVPVKIRTSISELVDDKPSLVRVGHGQFILSESATKDYNCELYTIGGRRLKSLSISSNQVFDIEKQEVSIMLISAGDKRYTYKIR